MTKVGDEVDRIIVHRDLNWRGVRASNMADGDRVMTSPVVTSLGVLTLGVTGNCKRTSCSCGQCNNNQKEESFAKHKRSMLLSILATGWWRATRRLR